MKSRSLFSTILFVGVCTIATAVLSNDSADKIELTQEVQRLRAEVSTLQKKVDFLLIELHFDESEMDALRGRVRYAETLHARVEALYKAGAPGGDQYAYSRCEAELRLANARLAAAKKEYDVAINHYDAAIDASKMAEKALMAAFNSGTAFLDAVLAGQQAVTDIQLELNRMRRSIQFLRTQQP